MSDGLDRRDETRRRGGHVDDLVAAYALDALEPGERARVDRHCRGCARCAGMVAADRAAVAPLGLLAPLATPGPAVRSALLARVAAAQAEADRPAAPARARPMVTLPASRPTDPQPARPAAPGRRGWFPMPPALARFAALPLILVLVAGGLAVESLGPGDGNPSQLANMATQTRPASEGSVGEPGAGSIDRLPVGSSGRDAEVPDVEGESDRSGLLALGVELLSFDTGLPGAPAATTSARLDLGRGAAGRATDADGGMDPGSGLGPP